MLAFSFSFLSLCNEMGYIFLDQICQGCQPFYILIMWSRAQKIIQGFMVFPAIATFYLFDSKVLSIRSTSGKSMEPTIEQNSILVVDRIFYKLFSQEIKKGDIVVSLQPVDPKTHICKRVIEVEGQSLEEHPQLKIPEGNVWLEGDNKGASYDSRHHGCVPMHLIEGKVLFVIPL